MESFSLHLQDLKLVLNLIVIYIRKSRGDKDKDVLKKHREALINYAEQLGVSYIIREEIGDSDSIEYRPVFKELLEEVREGQFDAVLVMHTDRLSRGDWKDVATYREAFRDSNTLVLTPHKIIDFSDENEELSNDFEALMARNEYLNIKRRFREGKINGIYLKQWVNGPAPFPYLYDPEKKGLVVNNEELPVYEMMKDDYIKGLSFQAIAFKLNNMGLLTRRKKFWSSVTVERTLFSEVHLGRIIYGKTTGSGHKNKKSKPLVHHTRDKWIVIENCHERVKTIEEHQHMLLIRESRQKVSKPARAWKFLLSGLLYCGKCGYAMRTNRKMTKKGESTYIIKCQKKDPYGHQCGNPGVNCSVILTAIETELKKYLHEFADMNQVYEQSRNKINSLIELKERSIQDAKKKIERINDGYNGGFYDIKEAKEQKQEQEEKIIKLEMEIVEYRENQSEYKGISPTERKEKIEEILTNMNNPKIEVSELNRLLRLIIDRVTYVRDGNEIDVDIKFL
ncbi:recombinase family protein [Virgibacillus sp. SK37]|uniref:recombinase family protein n=1 Tax=Virgibacillus sp. SK37 TaxID=403957 RepID=UPI0011A7EFC6|nr:recombinase family protein [Virgibacillus sp. SK37]